MSTSIDRSDELREMYASEMDDPLARMFNGAWLDTQEFPPLEYAVPGIVPEGFGLLVSPPKAGKSWLVCGIGLACATGGIALGAINVPVLLGDEAVSASGAPALSLAPGATLTIPGGGAHLYGVV